MEDEGNGWFVRRDAKALVSARKLKRENKELRNRLQALSDRLDRLEEKKEK